MIFQSIFEREMSDFLEIKEAEVGKDYLYRYRMILASFDKYLADIHWLKREISEDLISGWIQTVTVKKVTVAKKVSLLRNFIGYLQAIGIPAFLPKLPRTPKTYTPYIFSDEELTAIFSAADNFPQPKQSSSSHLHIEMPMLIRLLYGCGLRRGEALALKMQEVDLTRGIITLKKAKGEKERFVPMDSSLSKILRQYCEAMGLIPDSEQYLFPGRTAMEPLGGGVARSAFCSILTSVGITFPGKEKQERNACLHCFRHLFAVKSILQAEQEGRSVNSYDIVLPMYLGHQDFRGTDKYIHFNQTMLAETTVAFEEYTKGIIPEVLYEEE